MISVVITGSSRGLGLAMAREFLEAGCSLTLSGSNSSSTEKAAKILSEFSDSILSLPCNVQNPEEIEHLWDSSCKKWGKVDIWINNAGINQSDSALSLLTSSEIEGVIKTNLIGMMIASTFVVRKMNEQGGGQLFNMEGWGSNGKNRDNLNLYGTSKCALRYFTRGLISETKKDPVLVGLLSPGIMVTDFIKKPMEAHPEKKERVQRIYNILADLPETVAAFLVKRILDNNKHGITFSWLTGTKIFFRFALAGIRKRDLFT